MNPNSCHSPLGVCMYHLGSFCRVSKNNKYNSFNGAEIKRKPTSTEKARGSVYKKSLPIELLGKSN